MKYYLCVFILILTNYSFANYESSRKAYLNNEIQSRNVLSELYTSRLEIKNLHEEKSKTKLKIENITKSIEKIAPVVEKAESVLTSQKIQIQKRLLYISKFQDLSFLKILFSSQTPSQMDRNLRILKGVTEMDYINLKSYFLNTRALIVKKNELEIKKKELAKLVLELEDKETKLTQKMNQKNILVAKINREQKNLLVNLKKMREKNSADLSENKKEFLDVIFEPMFFEKKGFLKSPMQGTLYQTYGTLEHPVYKTQFRHKGFFIKPNSDNSVRSISYGKVSSVLSDSAFGSTVILDHGDHYYSVYAYLQNCELKLGQEIKEGDVIARAGHPHPFFGEGLYFELRHFSEPINPSEWIDKKTLRR